MADPPTYASLLTQWSGGGLAARQDVYAHLRAHPSEAAAVEASLRDELKAELAWRRIIAAEAMLAVYGDEAAAAAALLDVFRQGDSSAALDAIGILEELSPEFAGPPLLALAVHAPAVFRGQSPDFFRWAGSTAILSGDAADTWLTLFQHGSFSSESALFIGLAEAAPHSTGDLSEIEPAARARLFQSGQGYAAGAALWRLTWRVNRDWLATVNAGGEELHNNSALLVLLIEVLTEHLGRRPDLAPLVRDLVVRLANDSPSKFRLALGRLAKLGGRGWAVLLPLLGAEAGNAQLRTAVFDEAASWPGVSALAHHYAHAVILERDANRDAVPLELLQAAANALKVIGSAAGAALPDVLNLIAKQLDTARVLLPVIPALAPGFPNSVAAVARTLDRVCRSLTFRSDAFAELAEVYAGLDLAGALTLVEDTSFELRTLDMLLDEPAWNLAAPEVRCRHVLALADRLGSPRADVRARAAELLCHYADVMHAGWPALVALLAGRDERAALLVLPYFGFLAPVVDEVMPELVALFREPNPAFAARAVVALLRLGRMPAVTKELVAAMTAPNDAWGWAVLRGVVDRVSQPHGFLKELSDVFAAAPPEVAAKVHALLNHPELPEEAAISACIHPEKSRPVNWDDVYRCVCNDAEGGLLFLALMCSYGSAGFAAQKIWMIKQQRMATGTSLVEAKGIVECVVERLSATATPGDRHACVRDYFRGPADLPNAITDLLQHRLSWYRWAGLELLDAWGAPERVPALIEDRIWDRSPLVRARALRMHPG